MCVVWWTRWGNIYIVYDSKAYRNVFYNVQYVIMWSTFEAQAQARFGEEDYWSQDFDQEQNCAQKERIAELQDKVECRI